MKADRLRKLVMGLCIFFAFLAFSVGKLILAGIAIIIAIGFKVAYGGSFNDRNVYDKQITDAENLSIPQIYNAIKDIETPLGKAYMGNHTKYGDNVILIGPGVFKDYIVIYRSKNNIMLHSSCAINSISDSVDEATKEGFITSDNVEITPKVFSSFVSYKVMTSVLMNDLTEIITNLKEGTAPSVTELDLFTMYHYDSSDLVVRDINSNEYARTIAYFKPLSVTVYDMDGEEIATVNGDKNKMKEGFKVTMSGEDYGTFYRRDNNGMDEIHIDTPDGKFVARAFRAVMDGNVSSNYRVTLDGVDKAIVAGSKKVEFVEQGFVENDVICSFDDDYLLFYITLQDFIMALNHYVRA